LRSQNFTLINFLGIALVLLSFQNCDKKNVLLNENEGQNLPPKQPSNSTQTQQISKPIEKQIEVHQEDIVEIDLTHLFELPENLDLRFLVVTPFRNGTIERIEGKPSTFRYKPSMGFSGVDNMTLSLRSAAVAADSVFKIIATVSPIGRISFKLNPSSNLSIQRPSFSECYRISAERTGPEEDLAAFIQVNLTASDRSAKIYGDLASCQIWGDSIVTLEFSRGTRTAEFYVRTPKLGQTVIRIQHDGNYSDLPLFFDGYLTLTPPTQDSHGNDTCTGPFEVKVGDEVGNQFSSTSEIWGNGNFQIRPTDGVQFFKDPLCSSELGPNSEGIIIAPNQLSVFYIMTKALYGDYQITVAPPDNHPSVKDRITTRRIEYCGFGKHPDGNRCYDAIRDCETQNGYGTREWILGEGYDACQESRCKPNYELIDGKCTAF
jgi:hypothetical protein